MKAHLLYADRDFDLEQPLPWNAEALTRDLDLDRLFEAMAAGDAFLLKVARKVVLAGQAESAAAIRRRQAILEDCRRQPRTVRDLYALAVEAREIERQHHIGAVFRYPEWVLRQSAELVAALLDLMRRVRLIAEREGGGFRSEGGAALFEGLKRDLAQDYLDEARIHLDHVKLSHGLSIGARLGQGAKGRNYMLQPPLARRDWWARLLPQGASTYRFSIHPRDEAGARALSSLRGRGIGAVARTMARAADHVRGFFAMLRLELAFYVGCLNLEETLMRIGSPTCLPSPAAAEERRLAFRGLYDVTLALAQERPPVGNDLEADGRAMLVVTGANEGGKSTFLRSLGLAQLMMQCGLFAPANAFAASLSDGLFTHYKREEDPGMESGKLDEELARMSAIIEHLTPHPLILFNESFAATNEREGAEISRQILAALIETPARIVCVTHLYELARTLQAANRGDILFLRADRREDGSRSFRLSEGEPLETSFGEDLYENLFGSAAVAEGLPSPAATASQGRPNPERRAVQETSP